MKTLLSDPLHTFAEVIARGSFSAAANQLGLTQPAVSVQVRNLEDHIGTRLIERAGRRLHPTAAGKELLGFAQRIIEDERVILAKMKSHGEGRRGAVRLGTGATACIYRLPPLLSALRKAHPGFEITVVTGNAPELLSAVENNTLDMAIISLFGQHRIPATLPLCTDTLVAIMPSASKMHKVLTPRSLPDLPLILYERGDTIRAVIDSWFLGGKVQPQPAMELGSVEAIKNLVAAGLGYSIVPLVSVREPRHRAGLRVTPLAPKLRRRLGLATRRGATPDPAASAMIAALATLEDC